MFLLPLCDQSPPPPLPASDLFSVPTVLFSSERNDIFFRFFENAVEIHSCFIHGRPCLLLSSISLCGYIVIVYPFISFCDNCILRYYIQKYGFLGDILGLLNKHLLSPHCLPVNSKVNKIHFSFEGKITQQVKDQGMSLFFFFCF